MQMISIIVMLYNEAESLEDVMQDALHCPLPPDWTREVLVVDDGSTDGSDTLADRWSFLDPAVRIIHHPHNMGLGAVYRTGFQQARGDFCSFLPADGQGAMSETLKLMHAVDGHDMVLGLLPRRTDSKMGFLLSSLEKMACRLLLGNIPPFQGFLLVRPSIFRELPLKSRGRGWGVLLELIIRADRAGYRWTNVMTGLHPRRYGRSKVNNWKNILSNLRQMIALRSALRSEKP